MEATERDRLVKLETKVDEINKKLDKVIDDHEQRIRRLECKPAKRWDALVAAVISSGATAIITWLISRFS